LTLSVMVDQLDARFGFDLQVDHAAIFARRTDRSSNICGLIPAIQIFATDKPLVVAIKAAISPGASITGRNP